MEGYPLGKLLGPEVESEKGASNRRLYGNEGVKREVSPLKKLLGAYGGSEIGSSNGMSYGNIYGKIYVSLMEE